MKEGDFCDFSLFELPPCEKWPIFGWGKKCDCRLEKWAVRRQSSQLVAWSDLRARRKIFQKSSKITANHPLFDRVTGGQNIEISEFRNEIFEMLRMGQTAKSALVWPIYLIVTGG